VVELEWIKIKQPRELIKLNKKQVKVIVVILQLFMVGSMFLPAGRISADTTNAGDSSLSVFGMIDRYAGMGFSDDARFYMIMAFVFPVVIVFSILFLKDRKNFGIATVLSALYAAASACFFSASKIKMVDYATLTRLPYIIVFLSLVSMMFLILGFFYAAPGGGDQADDKKD
jgi:hypothetical protein